MPRLVRILPIAIIIFLSISGFSQELTFPIGHRESWEGIAKKTTKVDVDKFIKAVQKFGPYTDSELKNSYTLQKLAKYLHFVDINGDGRNDVVFAGQFDSEAEEVYIFINTGSSYSEVFNTAQGIVKMEWLRKRLSKIYIDDWGCCEDYLRIHMIFNVTYDSKNIPHFKKIYQSVSANDGETPDNLLERPFRFEVLNDAYKIRIAPKIDDSSKAPWENGLAQNKYRGNSIATLTKGNTGTALAKKIDTTGREWLFVQIDEAYFPKNKILYTSDDKFPTKLMGWISSRFIRDIEQ